MRVLYAGILPVLLMLLLALVSIGLSANRRMHTKDLKIHTDNLQGFFDTTHLSSNVENKRFPKRGFRINVTKSTYES